jgi:hypothetical protein
LSSDLNEGEEDLVVGDNERDRDELEDLEERCEAILFPLFSLQKTKAFVSKMKDRKMV